MARTCNAEKNRARCTCTFNCGKKGICCECVDYHRSMAELPGCYFPRDAEKTGNRTIAHFMTIVKERGTSYLT